MISTIVLVALSATLFECVIAHKWRWYRKMAGSNMLINFGGSMFLSYIVSTAWGMNGLIAGTAAMLSTILTVPYYRFMAWWDTSGQRFLANCRAAKQRWHNNWKDLVTKTVRVVEVTLRIITFPITAYRAVSRVLTKGA